jgi:16S rRNA (guanine(527)-N(7))-methyltransferase RsmG
VEVSHIAELLRPFLDPAPESPGPGGGPAVLLPTQLETISIYIDILLRWNSRINLTAVRQPEQIVSRHFGESLFAARHLFPPLEQSREEEAVRQIEVTDVGSGAGFPGIPIKIWAPRVHLTLIESNQKKATFLREIVRALSLTQVNVFAGRAADFHPIPSSTPLGTPADGERFGAVVALRAVERFDLIVPVAADLVGPSGRLAILVGQAQLERARQLVTSLKWAPPIKVPHSANRFLLLGIK